MATSWALLKTIASFLALNYWELQAIFSIKFLTSAGVISPRAPPLAASIILLFMLLSPL